MQKEDGYAQALGSRLHSALFYGFGLRSNSHRREIFTSATRISTPIWSELIDQGLNGWEGSLEGKFFPFVGIVADFSANYGDLKFPSPAGTCAIGVACSPVSVNTHVDNLLFGPRVSVSVGPVRPFAEAMFGAAHINTNGFGSDTSFATAIGGGLDYRIFHLLAWRFEGDFIHTLFSTPRSIMRASPTGVVLRF